MNQISKQCLHLYNFAVQLTDFFSTILLLSAHLNLDVLYMSNQYLTMCQILDDKLLQGFQHEQNYCYELNKRKKTLGIFPEHPPWSRCQEILVFCIGAVKLLARSPRDFLFGIHFWTILHVFPFILIWVSNLLHTAFGQLAICVSNKLLSLSIFHFLSPFMKLTLKLLSRQMPLYFLSQSPRFSIFLKSILFWRYIQRCQVIAHFTCMTLGRIHLVFRSNEGSQDLFQLIFFLSVFLCMIYHYTFIFVKHCMSFMYLCTFFNRGNKAQFTTALLGTLNNTFIYSHMARHQHANCTQMFSIRVRVKIIYTRLRKLLLYRSVHII